MATVHIRLLGGFTVTVDERVVPADSWRRRHAAGLVKLLAMQPERRLHREQVLDRLWPDDCTDEAAPKLHKAAHFARRALGAADSIVLRNDQVSLYPGAEVTVDVIRFDELARRALTHEDASDAQEAAALYGGDLLPEDRYDDWAEERRQELRLRFVDVLRLLGRWDDVIAIDPADEAATIQLMHRYAAAGDRHGAIRQFERLDRHLRRELGVTPGRDAAALRDRLVDEHDVAPRPDELVIGRAQELAVLHRAVTDAMAGSGTTVLVEGPAGIGKSTLLAELARVAASMRVRIGCGTSAPVEGSWSYAPVFEALADLCRRHPALVDGLSDHHRVEIDRALAGAEVEWDGASSHQRLFVAAVELVRLAAATNGLLLMIDDLHGADDASLRLLHYIARSTREDRVCLVLAHRPVPSTASLAETRRSLLDRHRAIAVTIGPLDDDEVALLVGRHVDAPGAELVAVIGSIAQGVPFVVNELARRAASEPDWTMALDTHMIAGVGAMTREVLQRVAVVGTVFDTDEFVALAGVDEAAAFEHLDNALAAHIVEPTSSGYRFRHALVRDALLADVPPHRRRLIHRNAAERLQVLGASPAQIGHHLLESGASTDAVPYVLRAAETEAAVGAYRDALALVDSIRPHATGSARTRTLTLRGDLLNAIADPAAVAAYREALDHADDRSARGLRARLARAAVMSGDLETAAAALDGLEPDGGDDDADIMLARGTYAFFVSDLDTARRIADEAQALILAGTANWKVLDLVALQGLLAHLSGNWFDRIRLELRRTSGDPEVANSIFDGHLCAAEYMLYGPTPYAEVIAVGRELQRTARRSGALRAAAFASALIGEAALLSGDLELAHAELCDAADLHRDVGSPAGEAHSLQRLAEVALALGDPAGATAHLYQALTLARGSMIANHLMQRIFGTLVLAAPNPAQARALVDRAEATLGWDESCLFCSIMLSVPAAIACARTGDIEHARRHLAIAESSAMLWAGTSWEAALAEAQAIVAAAEGDTAHARELMHTAIARFDAAAQPLDVLRCHDALAAI